MQSINSLRNALSTLQADFLLGGWEEALKNDIEETDDGRFILKGFELQRSEDGRTRQETTGIDFKSIRSSIIDSILGNLSERFECDEKKMEIIEPFVTFERSANLREIHKNFAFELDLTSIQLQYN